MSGIAALFAREGAPADTTLLARMIAAQRYRGPHGEGAWSRGSVGLGHTLHATTVEAERETSPASLEDRLFLTADARIDARDELRARLRGQGRETAPDATDPELILYAYDLWGERCLEHLLGDFSFALWDARRRQLFCAVDPLGTRAFYYADRRGTFVGSDDLACVRLADGVRDVLDERAVGDFLLLGGYAERDLTIYADVARIPPGHFLVVRDRGVRLTRYFPGIEPMQTPPPGEACLEAFRELLGRAVSDRLRTPKLAVTLSGGVDSPLVALTARRELARRFQAPALSAYCAVYDRLIPDDERHYAGLVAHSLSIPIDFQPMDGGSLFDWVGRLSPPEPIANLVMGPFLDQLSRLSTSSAVVLTGYDGDTLLRAALRLHWRERLARGELAPLARELWWYLRSERALPPVGVRTWWTRRKRARTGRRRPSWLHERFWTGADLARRWSRAAAPLKLTRPRDPSIHGFAGQAWAGFFESHDPAYLGRAVEFRHPLLDLRLIRFAAGLPAVPWCVNKHLLRRCLGELPAAIRRRPKTPLARDPMVELVRRGGLRSLPGPESSERLAPFLDLRAARGSLAATSDPNDETWIALRAVALASWLQQRSAGLPAVPLAGSAC